MSKGTRVTHTIDMKEGIKPFYKSLYTLLRRELRILRDYLAEKEKIDWIRRSKSSAEVPILFISKPDDSLRLYVDYRALNKVIIKNRHLLSLINETLDRM
jgi:hypothetical protein